MSALLRGDALRTPGVWPLPVARKLNVAAGGLSLMAQSNVFYADAGWQQGQPGGIPVVSPQGVLNWVNYFLGGKLNLYGPSAKVMGISGAQSGPTYPGASDAATNGSLLTRYQNPSDSAYMFGLASEPDVFIGQFDSGDDTAPPTMTLAQSLANLQQLHYLFRERYPDAHYIGTTLPGVAIGNSGDGGSNNEYRRQVVNAALRSFLPSIGAQIWDVEQEFTDPVTGLPPSGLANDSIHQNSAGAIRQARELARMLAPLVMDGSVLVPDPTNDSRCTVANGGWGECALLLPGSYGESSIGGSLKWDTNVASGPSASQYFRVTGPTGTVYSLVPSEDGIGYWQRLALPRGSAANQSLQFTMTFGAMPAGAQFYLECEVRTHGAFKQIAGDQTTSFGAQFNTNNAGCFGYLLSSNGNRSPYADPGAGVVGVIQSPLITVPAGGITGGSFTVLASALEMSFDVRRPSLVRVA